MTFGQLGIFILSELVRFTDNIFFFSHIAPVSGVPIGIDYESLRARFRAISGICGAFVDGREEVL